jgi:hypothetical protein
MHRSNLQTDRGGGSVFADLKNALGEIEEIRLSKGDGSRTTLHRNADGWTVVERQYPADAARVRELALDSPDCESSNRKPAIRLTTQSLESRRPDKPTAGSTLIEVVAGTKSLVLDRRQGRRRPRRLCAQARRGGERLAQPLITADPDQALDRSASLPTYPAPTCTITVKPSSARRADARIGVPPM